MRLLADGIGEHPGHHHRGQAPPGLRRRQEYFHHEITKKIAATTFDVGYSTNRIREPGQCGELCRRLSSTPSKSNASCRNSSSQVRATYGECMIREALTAGAVDRLLISESLRKNITDLSCDTCKHTWTETVDRHDSMPSCPSCDSHRRRWPRNAHRRAHHLGLSEQHRRGLYFRGHRGGCPTHEGFAGRCAVALPDDGVTRCRSSSTPWPTTCKRPASVGVEGDLWRRVIGPARERKEGDVALPCFPCQDGRTRSCGHRRGRGRGDARSRGPVRGAATNGYLNLVANPAWLAAQLLDEAGPSAPVAPEDGLVLIEHTSANPNGPSTSVAPATPSSATRWSV